MRYLAIVLVIVSVLLLSGMVSAAGSSSTSQRGSNNFDSTPQGIGNFVVHVNSQSIEVFKYFNVSGHTQSFGLPEGNEYKTVPLFWEGSGNISILAAIPFSDIGVVNYSYSSQEYVYFYQSDYLGILFTTGQIAESGNQLYINGPDNQGGFSVAYMNSPLSNFNFVQNSFEQSGQSYYGNYSSFAYSAGQIENYSLMNRQSSVSIVSSISSSGSDALSFNTKDLAVPGTTGIFVSDDLFPTVYLGGFNSTLTIRLASGFDFGVQGENHPQGSGPNQDPSFPGMFPFFQEHIFKVMNGPRTLGYVDVYGTTSVNTTTLVVNSPMSFVLIRFLPSFQSTNGINPSNDHLENATTEIFVDNEAYFVPFSTNVTSQNLSFSGGRLNFQFIQNGTQQFVIVIQGNFSVSMFSLNGTGANPPPYVVTRASNQTIISFASTGNGTQSLSLSIAPYVGSISILPLMALLISALALTLVAGSLIFYSRRKSIREFEKG